MTLALLSLFCITLAKEQPVLTWVLNCLHYIWGESWFHLALSKSQIHSLSTYLKSRVPLALSQSNNSRRKFTGQKYAHMRNIYLVLDPAQISDFNSSKHDLYFIYKETSLCHIFNIILKISVIAHVKICTNCCYCVQWQGKLFALLKLSRKA